MAANTKALPRMDMIISGALRTQFMMIIVSGAELASLCEFWSFILKLKGDQMIFPFFLALSENLNCVGRQQHRENNTSSINSPRQLFIVPFVIFGTAHYESVSGCKLLLILMNAFRLKTRRTSYKTCSPSVRESYPVLCIFENELQISSFSRSFRELCYQLFIHSEKATFKITFLRDCVWSN